MLTVSVYKLENVVEIFVTTKSPKFAIASATLKKEVLGLEGRGVDIVGWVAA